MSEFTTVEHHVDAWYRLVGSVANDQSLIEQGEDPDDVVYLNLTRGCRRAQRYMLRLGFGGWRKRTSALTFTGSDNLDGGVMVTALPSDFLRAYGDERRSALTRPNGDRWGFQVNERDDHLKGDTYYFRGHELWLGRTASPPTTLFLDYHYQHPIWDSQLQDGDIDFPLEARPLIPAEAAFVAMSDNWLPGGRELEQKIDRAVKVAQEEARHIARPTKQPRQFMKVRRFGNRW